MKICIALTAALTMALCTAAQAQSVSSRAPIVPSSYVTASSPVGNGQIVTTTYRASSQTVPVTRDTAPVKTVGWRSASPASFTYSATTPTTSLSSATPTVAGGTTITTYPSTPSTTTNFAGTNVATTVTTAPATTVPSTPYYTPTTTPVNSVTTLQPTTTFVGDPCACTPVQTTVALPATTAPGIAVPTTAPAIAVPTTAVATTCCYPRQHTWRPVLPLRRDVPIGTYVGQGFLGQPKAFVNGEPVRNFFRYIFP